jgi:glycolate oxidase
MRDPVAAALETGQVLSPACVADVQALIRDAGRAGARVAVDRPGAGAVRVSLERLDRILEIDPGDHLARVEAGVRLDALAGALAERGLRFVPGDGPFHRGARVGELYRRGLGHPRTLKYGAAKHFLLGSRIVLPDGELLATGGRTVKNVTGYDLTRFLDAPLASLGVPVELTVKVHPLPPARRTLRIRFAALEAAAGFALAARDAVGPAFLLWADPEAQRLAGDDEARAQLVLVELDGAPEEVAEAASAAAALAEARGGSAGELAGAEVAPAAAALDPARGAAAADELAVELAALPAFAAGFGAAAVARGVRAGLFGKLAEGVLSVRVAPAGDAAIAAALEAAAGAGARPIGRWARARGRVEGPMAEVERELSRLLDPAGVLAP